MDRCLRSCDFPSESEEADFVGSQAAGLARTQPVAILCRTKKQENFIQERLPAWATQIDRNMRQWPSGPRLFYGTYHSAKGLEFDSVFLPFLSEQHWPNPSDIEALGPQEAAAKDSLLLYVGITRARATLVLTYSGKMTKLLPSNGGLYPAMTETTTLIQAEVEKRRITRLCHFTPSRNLGHIAADKEGILASRHLQESEKASFNPTDIKRLDGYTDHVCCSIQYPNARYFKVARKREQLFLDWVVLFIRTDYLWRAGTKFCPRNAAAKYGRLVREGSAAFKAFCLRNMSENTHAVRSTPIFFLLTNRLRC